MVTNDVTPDEKRTGIYKDLYTSLPRLTESLIHSHLENAVGKERFYFVSPLSSSVGIRVLVEHATNVDK